MDGVSKERATHRLIYMFEYMYTFTMSSTEMPRVGRPGADQAGEPSASNFATQSACLWASPGLVSDMQKCLGIESRSG
jgi:hypothetical protein